MPRRCRLSGARTGFRVARCITHISARARCPSSSVGRGGVPGAPLLVAISRNEWGGEITAPCPPCVGPVLGPE